MIGARDSGLVGDVSTREVTGTGNGLARGLIPWLIGGSSAPPPALTRGRLSGIVQITSGTC